ncbi:MAG: glycine--tRNA ligase subunit beta [Candidatus Omnitrophota bacterium]
MKEDTRDFLLDIKTEELPASYIEGACDYLENSFRKESILLGRDEKDLSIVLFAAKDSLCTYIKDLPIEQKESFEEILGPPKHIAYDSSGAPTMATIGFAKKLGVKVEDLKEKPTPRGEYVVIEKKKHARNTIDILKEISPLIIKTIPFPKTMKWDDSGVSFARPIKSIAALFGKENIPIEIGSVPQEILEATSPEKYCKKLKKASFRKEEIKNLVKRSMKELDADEVIDNNLLEEVNFLVNSPRVFIGGFDKKFLELPQDVLKASMAKHQRIFPVVKDKKLVNKFIAVIEDGKKRDMKAIKKNYEFILEAKLKDSLFFFVEDTKRPLSENLFKLKDLIFQKELGNMFEKIERLKKLASFMADELKEDSSLKKDVERAAYLSKADLVTHMVGEFPSLQGVIGKVYALKNSENKRVAEAIGEQYLPQGMDDNIPETLSGSILAISDRIDNIVGFLGMGVDISGSFDPFGLRRNSQGLIQIIKTNSIRIQLDRLIERSIALYQGKLKLEKEALKEKALEYIKERIDYLMGDVRPPELKKAVLGVRSYDIVGIFKRIKELSSISNAKYFSQAAKVVERTSNILKASKEDIGKVDTSLFKEKLEKEAWDSYVNSKEKIEALIKKEMYKDSTLAYAEAFYKVLHEFFDNVMVNVEDAAVRKNRLSLMKAINSLYSENVADLARLPQITVG